MKTLDDMIPFDQSLDDALIRLAAGEDSSSILDSFPSYASDLASLLAISTRLAPLQDAPDLAPDRLAAGRRSMLEAAARRRRGGLAGALARFRTAAQLRLTSGLRAHPLTAIMAALILVAISAGGGAVAASSDSLPGSPFYPVKLASEQVQIMLTIDQHSQSDLKIVFEERRQLEQEQLDRRQAAVTPTVKGVTYTATALVPSPAAPTPTLSPTLTPSPDRDEDTGRAATTTLGPSPAKEPDEPEKAAPTRTPRATEKPEPDRTRTPESTPSVQVTPERTPSPRASRTPEPGQTPETTRTPTPPATRTPRAGENSTAIPKASTSPTPQPTPESD